MIWVDPLTIPASIAGLGYLTIETLKGILLELEPSLEESQLMEIVEEVDEDGSGTIDFDGEMGEAIGF